MFEFITSRFVDLIDAACKGYTDILRYHLTKPNVDVNQCQSNTSVLYFALLYDHNYDRLPCVISLLEAGADPNKGVYIGKNRWKSCLPLCAENRTEWPMIRLLVSYGADPDGTPDFDDWDFDDWGAEDYAVALVKKVKQRDQLLENTRKLLTKNHGKPTLEIIKNYETVGDYWWDLSKEKRENEEDVPIIQEHFGKKAKFYYDQANEWRRILQMHSRQERPKALLSEATLFFPFSESNTGNGMRYRANKRNFQSAKMALYPKR